MTSNEPVVVTIPVPNVQVTLNPQEVILSSPGPQGERGPAGPAGGSPFEFVQTSPSNSWVINHDLDRFPGVIVFVDGDLTHPVDADVTYSDRNNLTVSFLAPHSGKAELE